MIRLGVVLPSKSVQMAARGKASISKRGGHIAPLMGLGASRVPVRSVQTAARFHPIILYGHSGKPSQFFGMDGIF